MKLIEAMNALKLTEKKLSQQLGIIQRYAARPSFRDDAFGKPGEETKQIKAAIQAANDLIAYHEKIKRQIDYTNMMTMVKIGKQEHSIHSLILHKRTLLKLKVAVYSALSDVQAQQEIAQLRSRSSDQKLNAQVVYNYDLQERESKLTELMELSSAIDSALQIANAKVELLEVPEAK